MRECGIEDSEWSPSFSIQSPQQLSAKLQHPESQATFIKDPGRGFTWRGRLFSSEPLRGGGGCHLHRTTHPHHHPASGNKTRGEMVPQPLLPNFDGKAKTESAWGEALALNWGLLRGAVHRITVDICLCTFFWEERPRCS